VNRLIGCLFIHGFTGAPYEVEPLVEYLKDRTDWNFRVPTLPGHGESLSLKGVQYRDWIGHAEKELQTLMETSDQVYVIGFSMGGLIASFLAANYKVDKLVLLSAAAYYFNPKQLAADIKTFTRDIVNGNIQNNDLFWRYKQKITDTPLTATLEFSRLVSYIKPNLPNVLVPTLIAQGELDGIVPSKSADYLYRTIGAAEKRLIYIPGSKHHICHCEEKEVLFTQVLDFLAKNKL
jgi:carboxylesterase